MTSFQDAPDEIMNMTKKWNFVLQQSRDKEQLSFTHVQVLSQVLLKPNKNPFFTLYIYVVF